jgi:hypothetical protein
MSLYRAIAEHVTDGRAPEIDANDFAEFLSSSDQGGNDFDWKVIDSAIGRLIGRYKIRRYFEENQP